MTGVSPLSSRLLHRLIILLLLGGCTEAQLAVHMAKRLDGEGPPTHTGTYKVGNPYKIDGEWYYPKEQFDRVEVGIASWYGPNFHGKPTANGEIFDQNLLTAAHRTLQLTSLARVTNLGNGRSVVVRVNDRGPYAKDRVIDLSRRAAQVIGMEKQGIARVRVEVLEAESRALADASRRGEAKMIPVTTAATTAKAEPQPPERLAVADPPVVDGALFVQAGAFIRAENAYRLRKQLSHLAPILVTPVNVDGTEFYRVRLGPLDNLDSADRLLAAIHAEGHDGARVITD